MKNCDFKRKYPTKKVGKIYSCCFHNNERILEERTKTQKEIT